MNTASNGGGALSRRTFLKSTPAVLAVPLVAPQALAQAGQEKAAAAAAARPVEAYTAMQFDLGKLDGFSDEQIEVHLGLYQGYVTNVNALNKELAELTAAGKAGSPAWAEIKRRLGFEYGGMRLHEYYFGNLKGGTGKLETEAPLGKALAASYGSVDAWKQDFVKMSGMRGIGWVITCQDPWNGRLSNHWITLHEEGNPPGFTPIVVMDVWEHAFMVDWRPKTKGKYVETFFKNLDFGACAERLAKH